MCSCTSLTIISLASIFSRENLLNSWVEYHTGESGTQLRSGCS